MCGIDIVATISNEPITGEIGAVIEVNACPGSGCILCPAKGLSRNVGGSNEYVVPERSQLRVFHRKAITGTNGKTTTTRLTAHIAKQAGHKVGFTTTEGIYLHGQMVHEGRLYRAIQHRSSAHGSHN